MDFLYIHIGWGYPPPRFNQEVSTEVVPVLQSGTVECITSVRWSPSLPLKSVPSTDVVSLRTDVVRVVVLLP